MNNWSAEAWRSVVDSAPEGIVVCDATVPDHPVIYANTAFAQMCGYPVAALLGTNLRILQGTDKDQEARLRIKEAIEKGEPARVLTGGEVLAGHLERAQVGPSQQVAGDVGQGRSERGGRDRLLGSRHAALKAIPIANS